MIFRRPPLIPYSYDLHTGNNVWGIQGKGWSLLTGPVPCFWITCNGQRVDLRPIGFPRAYYVGDPTCYLETLHRNEATSRAARRLGLTD